MIEEIPAERKKTTQLEMVYKKWKQALLVRATGGTGKPSEDQSRKASSLSSPNRRSKNTVHAMPSLVWSRYDIPKAGAELPGFVYKKMEASPFGNRY